jgi:ribose transport system substrate-binding protein
VDQWIAGISDAVSEKDTLVNLWSGVNPDVLVPQIKAATAAGVKVVSTDTYDFTQTPNPALSAAALSDHSLAAQLLADIAFVDTDGKPNVLMIGSDEIKATRPMIKAMKDELAALCPTCAVEHLNVPAPEWATKIQAGVQAALIANPKINFILPVYDSMTQFVIPALRITNRMGAVKIASADGTPFVIDMVRNGQIAADVGSSLGWLGYAGLDAAMREMCGLPMVHRLNTPFFVFDQSNAATAGVPANYNDGYGNSHVAGFRKLWGLQ